MKKAYSKPMLLCEDFRLSQSVAYGCTTGQGLVATTRSTTDCVIESKELDVIIFSTACGFDIDEFKSSCYNNPGDGYHPFAS